MVYTELVQRHQQFHVAPAIELQSSAVSITVLVDIQKHTVQS